MAAGVMPPRTVLPDSVELEVNAAVVDGEVMPIPSSKMGETRAFSD
jgi:hypothetical protein